MDRASSDAHAGLKARDPSALGEALEFGHQIVAFPGEAAFIIRLTAEVAVGGRAGVDRIVELQVRCGSRVVSQPPIISGSFASRMAGSIVSAPWRST